MSYGVLRVDSNYPISSISLEQIEPQLYISTSLPEPLYSVDFDGQHFKIVVNGRERILSIASENLRKIRHEIVSDVMLFESDSPLSKLGVVGEESILTPDFINVEKGEVLEVTTTAISELFSLKRAYNGKYVKYSYLVEPIGCKLFILVVSPSRVFCNFKLTQDVVNCLCYRMRIGLAVESVISEHVGSDIFFDDAPMDESIVKDVFRGIKGSVTSEFDFDVGIIESSGDKPTLEEMKLTGKAFKKTLMESTLKDDSTDEKLKEYLEGFDIESKTSNKRVCNIPMIYQSGKSAIERELDPDQASDMPLFLKKIWSDSKSIKPSKLSEEEQVSEAMGYKSYEKHRVQKSAAFNCKSLTEADRIEASKTGLWAKSRQEHLVEKTIEDKKSFHPVLTNTDDIDAFLHKKLLANSGTSSIPPSIMKLLVDGKKVWNNTAPLSIRVLSKLSKTVALNFGQTITNHMSEICYAHKYWIKRSDFYHKETNGIHLLIRCTGAHIFVCFAFNKSNSTVIDTGRIGPTIWESRNYYFTDVCSFSEPVIEHFVKAGPYIGSIICHLFSHLEMHLENLDFSDDVLNEHLSLIVLLYLNNKTDAEELITSQRYLTMGILEELDPNPWRFCERLPEVVRSRLTCFLIKRTIEHMRYYAESRVMKIPNAEVDEYDISYKGLKSLFSSYEPSLKQKVNEFYFGYVISKEKGRGNDRNFKIMKKIVAEEYRFRDTVVNTFSTSLDPQIHVSNPIVIKVFNCMFKEVLKTYLGKDYDKIIRMEITKSLSKCTFDDLATLKVSAREYQESIIVPTITECMNTRKIRDLYEKANPIEVQKRPRAMESIKSLVDEYTKSKGKSPKHPIELLPYCLDELRSKGYWDSDIFPKSQHGGDREIHVLEIQMRVVQFFTETISRTLCRLVPSDTLTHPYEKESFVRNHYKEAQATLGNNYFTLGKSADATKWCQRNDSSKFAAVTLPFIPDEFKSFFMIVMRMWKDKRFSFPIQFAANFQSNKNTPSNKIYERMRKEFLEGGGIFTQVQSNKIRIRSGMMQGILHYTSSFTHSVIQEVMKKMQIDYLKRRGLNAVITVVQGSDDSAELISLEGTPSKNRVRLATTMLHWKENMSKYFSIYTSRAKSAIGTLDLIEYNSEWNVRTNTIKPTFRWASACLETTVTERFIDRVRINYNISSQVLEGGGKVFEVALIQLCQAWMHYILLGLHSSDLTDRYVGLITRLKDPALGYYPLDSDYIAGVTGVDFQLYNLVLKSNYGVGLSFANLHEPTTRVEGDEIEDASVAKNLRAVVIKFSDSKLWKDQVRRMGVPELEKLIEEVEANPWLIYAVHKSWDEAKYSIFLKMFQPGVKESISKYSAAARMMSASAYMLSRPCVSVMLGDTRTKMSLIKACYYQEVNIEGKSKEPIERMFMHSNEYNEVLEYVTELENESSLIHAKFKTRSKQKICVFEKALDDIPIIDICRKVWFNLGRLPLSNRQIKNFWNECKLKYPFLHDSREVTKAGLNMNEVELKNFLESITSRPRHIVLLDTSARSASLFNSITRVFWSGTKIVIKGKSDLEENSFALRSKLFTILSSWYDTDHKLNLACDLIKTSTLLSKTKVPSRVLKLKVLNTWLNTQNKELVCRQINSEKIGTIGYFTARQKGWGENRRGYGEWRGRVLDNPVVIRMMGNECTSIEIRGLSDLRSLGSALSELVISFSLITPRDRPVSEHWLTMSGRIIGGYGRGDDIPMMINPDLDISIIDKIIDYNWEITASHNRIRLIADYDKNLKITVLSIPFSSKDWDPMFSIKGDKALEPWSSGKPISIATLEEEFRPIAKETVGSVMTAYRRRYMMKTANNWNLGEFISVVNRQLLRNNPLPVVEEEPELSSDDAAEVNDMDLEAMMAEINADIQTELFIDYGEAFNDDDDFDADLFQMDDILFDQLKVQLALFENVAVHEFQEYQDNTTMSRANMCFSSLDRLANITLDCNNFEEAVSMFKFNNELYTPGFLGILLSYFVGRPCFQIYDPEHDEELEDIETGAATLVKIMTDESNILNLPEDQLESYLPLIDDAIAATDGRIQSRFMKSKEKVIMALGMIQRAKLEHTELENFKTDIFLMKLKPILIRENLISSSFTSLSDGIYLAVMKNELDHAVDLKCKDGFLTLREQSVYREAIRKHYLTTLLVDAISFKYDLGITIPGYHGAGTVEYIMDQNMTFIRTD